MEYNDISESFPGNSDRTDHSLSDGDRSSVDFVIYSSGEEADNEYTGIILAAVIVGGTDCPLVYSRRCLQKFAVEVDESEKKPSLAFFLEITAVAVVMPDVPDLQQLS